MTKQGQRDTETRNQTAQTARILVDTRVFVCWTVLGEKYAKTRQVLKIFESDSLT